MKGETTQLKSSHSWTEDEFNANKGEWDVQKHNITKTQEQDARIYKKISNLSKTFQNIKYHLKRKRKRTQKTVLEPIPHSYSLFELTSKNTNNTEKTDAEPNIQPLLLYLKENKLSYIAESKNITEKFPTKAECL